MTLLPLRHCFIKEKVLFFCSPWCFETKTYLLIKFFAPKSCVISLRLRQPKKKHILSTWCNNRWIFFRVINQRPQLAQFLCLKNIRLFLKACSDTFGISKESDLFQPSMLYDFTDFVQVLHTLAKLSQSQKARIAKPHVASFPNSKTR